MPRDVTITKLRRNSKRYTTAFVLATLSIVGGINIGCTNIDCPLDNVVVATCGLYAAEDHSSLTLSDTLSVIAGGVKDTILLNRAQDIQTFQLPLRQGATVDTLLFRLSNTTQAATDTIFLEHTNTAHFESVDCPAAVFHNIVSARWTSHALSQMPMTIDSVAVTRPLVNYDDIENVKIFLRSTSL